MISSSKCVRSNHILPSPLAFRVFVAHDFVGDSSGGNDEGNIDIQKAEPEDVQHLRVSD